MAIYLGQMSPPGSSDLPESRRATLCFLLGLASSGVYMCPACYQTGGSLLHCHSTLTGHGPAVYFCCTVPGVTSARRYLAPCPVKPGLSSPAAFRLMRQRPFVLLKPAMLSLPSTARAVNHRCLRSRPQSFAFVRSRPQSSLLFGRRM